MESRILTWTAEGVMVDDHTTAMKQGRKGMFVSNKQIFGLADKIERDLQHSLIKKKLGDIEGPPGIVMLSIADAPDIKRYQIYCSWFPNWCLRNIGCCLELSYQDNSRGQEGILSVIVRKKYKDQVKSITKIMTEPELQNIVCSIDVKRIADDALIRMDSTHSSEKRVDNKRII